VETKIEIVSAYAPSILCPFCSASASIYLHDEEKFQAVNFSCEHGKAGMKAIGPFNNPVVIFYFQKE
jgi:hypothetical protein